MLQSLFPLSNTLVSSSRIIYTPSVFARSSLIYLQETGTLHALHPHKSERNGLQSCLFFTVLKGGGKLTYRGKDYYLKENDCVFLDCRKAYSHETGNFATDHHKVMTVIKEKNEAVSDTQFGKSELWSLQWCHFYGPNMSAIYRKYQERGGKPVCQTNQLSSYRDILDELYHIAGSADYVRDMRIHEKLSSLLILLMEDAWDSNEYSSNPGNGQEDHGGSHVFDIQQVKEYLDVNFKNRITIDDLAGRFFVNKYYLMKLFKDCYGMTINVYLNQTRITYVKQQLRFTDKTVDELSVELHIESAYLSRLFKKIEGVNPTQFRRIWRGG